ncbi:MAG: ABC transporter ATP-binding protein [Burkholderiaceae bacterium]
MNPPATIPSRAQGDPPRTDASMLTPVLVVRGLTKSYGDRVLLHDLSFTVGPARKLALMGESGAGKSTLLNIVAGLEPFDSGQVALLGQALPRAGVDASADLRRRMIGFVFQAFHLVAYLPVWQNVALPLMLLGQAPEPARRRAFAWLDRVGVGNRAQALARDLSGGEQQRVAIARALIHEPALVLADEPTGNLDTSTAERILRLLRDAVDDTGAALLMVTHSERAAATMDGVLTLVGGALYRPPDRPLT